jgi:glyoxylase-like metal-dependent hydrolase (beta-lactamase superfamily II)
VLWEETLARYSQCPSLKADANRGVSLHYKVTEFKPSSSVPDHSCTGTNTYIVGTGSQRLLIDTGEGKPAWIAAIKRALREENIQIAETILTHWHPDHVGGQKHLQEVSPATKFYKNTPSDGQLDIEDGQTFQVEGATLRTVHSPGHTQDHMALILEEEDAMFTGDNVLGYGTAVFEDLGIYLNSLEKMRGAFKGRAYPGHGPVIEDGPSKILEYIHHRKMREDQVIKVLKSKKQEPGVVAGEPDAWTSMEIVKFIYRDVPEDLHLPAHGGILQILMKLEREEKVVVDERTERWRIRDRAIL